MAVAVGADSAPAGELAEASPCDRELPVELRSSNDVALFKVVDEMP